MTNILPHLPAPMAMEGFIAAIRDCLSGLERRPLSGAEVRAIEKLSDEKYSSWEWNWGESPAFTERKERRFPWGKVEALLTAERIITRARFTATSSALRPVELRTFSLGAAEEELENRLSSAPGRFLPRRRRRGVCGVSR